MREKEQALRLIRVLRRDLSNRYDQARKLGILMSTPMSAVETLKSWETRAVSEISRKISPTEAQNFEAERLNNYSYISPFNILETQVKKYDEFLIDLAIEIEQHPNGVLAIASPDTVYEEQKLTIDSPEENAVFIVHGHDEVNRYKLRDLLRDRYKLSPITLDFRPGRGRTIIEKFEDEAQKAAFAFVLLTPDDIIQKDASEYSQARPNVIFELGWFYGCLGRDKVCILYKEGTKIHSDLEGVSRVEFKQYVNEKVEEIERELVEGGLLTL